MGLLNLCNWYVLFNFNSTPFFKLFLYVIWQILLDSIVRWTRSRRRKQSRSESWNKIRMGQRCAGSMSTQYMGRDALFADAVDFSTGWNIPVNSDYFHFTNYYSHHHFFTVCDQHERKSKRRYTYIIITKLTYLYV